MKLNKFLSLKFEMHKEGETNPSQPELSSGAVK